MLSLRVKKDRRSCGNKINHSRKMAWYVVGVYTCIINRTLHGRLETGNFPCGCGKYFTRLHECLQRSQCKFRISARAINRELYQQ